MLRSGLPYMTFTILSNSLTFCTSSICLLYALFVWWFGAFWVPSPWCANVKYGNPMRHKQTNVIYVFPWVGSGSDDLDNWILVKRVSSITCCLILDSRMWFTLYASIVNQLISNRPHKAKVDAHVFVVRVVASIEIAHCKLSPNCASYS